MTAILTNRITPAQFVDKWRPVTLTERSAAHSHFLDLCQMFDHPTPIEMDPTGQEFTFEKGVHKAGGGEGFADVWKRGYFAWEYKKRKRNLDEALGQLSRYALALENPPLQIVCDTDRFRIVTAYTNSVPKSYDLSLEDILDAKKRSWLEAAFWEPRKLQPGASRSELTRSAADKFSSLAQRLQAKGHSVEDVGHFVNRLVFLFFAEDVRLLKEGFFRRTVSELAGRPSDAQNLLTELFQTFKTGGRFGLDRLPWINGGLFDDREALPLDEHEIGLLKAASSQNWAHIDPTIFGTLFERFLDPDKRAQIGAHYTDSKKIAQIIEPVVLRPLREEWRIAKSEIEKTVTKARSKGLKSKEWQRAEERRSVFLERLRKLSILDPACGSGNFLYLALRSVKDLENTANQECEALGLPPRMPMVGPEIIHGIEINSLAAELARTTIWIGDIQWAMDNGIRSRPEPILRKLDNIQNRDALINKDGSEASWPDAEFIVGNPPFLGSRKLQPELGQAYVSQLRSAYKGRINDGADLVCFWFLKAREAMSKACERAGLVATNSISGGSSQQVIIAIVEQLSDVWTNVPWTIEGAAVSVHLICFTQDKPHQQHLNGTSVVGIYPDLHPVTVDVSGDLSQAKALSENASCAYQGIVPRSTVAKKIAEQKKLAPASFVIDGVTARKLLRAPTNPNGRANTDVIFPYLTGDDVASRSLDRFIVDFRSMSEHSASLYEGPYEAIKSVRFHRAAMEQPEALLTWWQHWRSRPEALDRLSRLSRYIVTPRVAKYRIFVWKKWPAIPDNALVAIAKDDDCSFGILHSKYHEAWSLRLGTSLEDRPRYTSSTTFEKFCFPEGLTPNIAVDTYANSEHAEAIAAAAAEMNRLREAWLNPPDLVRIESEVVPGYPNRMLPRDAAAAVELKKRTLTNLYNARPTWLAKAHDRLDRAVAAAYGWPEDISTEDALAALLKLNLERAAAQGKA